MSLIKKTALSPFWIAGKVIAPIKPERIQGAILGAAALALLLGYTGKSHVIDMTPEIWAQLEQAEADGLTIWNDPRGLAPLSEDYYTPEEEDVPIPARKPEFGYTAQDRAELNQLFAEVTK